LTAKGFGIRTGRFAIIVDDLIIKYIKVRLNSMSGRSFRLIYFFLSFSASKAEPSTGVTVSGADAVLAAL